MNLISSVTTNRASLRGAGATRQSITKVQGLQSGLLRRVEREISNLNCNFTSSQRQNTWRKTTGRAYKVGLNEFDWKYDYKSGVITRSVFFCFTFKFASKTYKRSAFTPDALIHNTVMIFR